MKTLYSIVVPLALSLLMGCGGSDHHLAPAKSLSYTDPTAAAGEWKLLKDAASTDTHLVLNLVGPSDGSTYRGIGFTLQADPALVKFARLPDPQGKPGGYYKDGGVFLDKEPFTSDHKEIPTNLQAGGVSNGKLMVGIFQKTDEELYGPEQGATAKDCSGVVLQVALDFDASLNASPGDVPLTVIKARVIPKSIGTILKRKTEDVTFKVGTLKLQ